MTKPLWITNDQYEAMAAAIGQGYDQFLLAVPENELDDFSPRDTAMRFQVPLLLSVVREIIDSAIEEAAKAAEGFEDPSRDWLRRSVWDAIKCDTAARIRRLKGASA
jgi:hypothetical protein